MFGSVSFAVIHTRLGVTASQLQQSEARLEITSVLSLIISWLNMLGCVVIQSVKFGVRSQSEGVFELTQLMLCLSYTLNKHIFRNL